MQIPLELLMVLLVGGGILVRVVWHVSLAVIMAFATIALAGWLYQLAAPAAGIPQPTLFEASRDAAESASQAVGAIVHPPTPTPAPTRTLQPTWTYSPTSVPPATPSPVPPGVPPRPPNSPMPGRSESRSVAPAAVRESAPQQLPQPRPSDVLPQAIALARRQDAGLARLLDSGVVVRWAPADYFSRCSFTATVYWEGEILMNRRCPASSSMSELTQAIRAAARTYSTAARSGTFCRVPKYDWRQCQAQGGPQPRGGRS